MGRREGKRSQGKEGEGREGRDLLLTGREEGEGTERKVRGKG